MAESFVPLNWTNDSGLKLNAANLNAVMAGIDSIDVRAAALELGIAAPVTVTYAASVTLDAALGRTFWITATGNVTVADIVNGVNGQIVELEVLASGADRTVSFAGGADAATVPAGQLWVGEFRYRQALDTWFLRAS